MASHSSSDDLSSIPKAFQDSVKKLLCKTAVHLMKRVKLETKTNKFEDRILVLTAWRFYLFGMKTPAKVDSSFNYLEIKNLITQLQNQLVIETEKSTYSIRIHSLEDLDQVVSHVNFALTKIFPGPSNTAMNRQGTYDSLDSTRNTSPNSEVSSRMNRSACGGFSDTYAALCDYNGLTCREEVQWDVDTIYHSQDNREFNLLDFSHLESRDLALIVASLAYNQWFSKLSCKDLRLGADVIEQILHTISKSSNLEYLVLENTGLKTDFLQKLALALSENPNAALHSISLSGNQLEEKGIWLFSQQLSRFYKGMKHMNLSRTSITAKGLISLSQALTGNPVFTSTLTYLDLSKNSGMLVGEEASALYLFLAQPNSLMHLDLSGTDCAVDTLFGALLHGCCTHLTYLNLAQNAFSHKKVKDILPSFKQFFSSAFSLNYINLSGIKLPVDALKALLQGLSLNPHIADANLDLSCCELKSAGAHVFEETFADVQAVGTLDLSDNGFDSDMVTLVPALGKNKFLKHLSMGKNFNVKSRTLEDIINKIVHLIQEEDCALQSLSVADSRLKSRTSILINALGSNVCLTKVDISGNIMEDIGAKMLAKALQINSTLRTVLWDRNNITATGFTDVARALENNYSVKYMPIPVSDVTQAYRSNPEKTEEAIQKTFEYACELDFRHLFENTKWFDADSNITPSQRSYLKNLGNLPVRVIKPDKGGGLVILDKNDYILKMIKILDSSAYEKSSLNETNCQYNRIKGYLRDLFIEGKIDTDTFNFINISFPRVPIMFGIPKIHKNLEDPPMRALVDGRCCITHPSAKVVDHFINKYLKALPQICKDSWSFLGSINSIPFNSSHSFLTIDVVDLYTSIPHFEAVEWVELMLIDLGAPKEEIEVVTTLLEIILSSNFFIFNNQHYLQNKGIAMGSPCGGSVANLVVAYWEKVCLFENPLFKECSKFYTRFLDDAFVLIDGNSDTMMDRLCIKVQNDVKALRGFPVESIQEDVHCAKEIMKDARNSRALFPSLYELGHILAADGPIRHKLESVASEVSRAVDKELQVILDSMVNLTEDLCPYALRKAESHKKMLSAISDRVTVSRSFVRTVLLEQAGVEIQNKLNELKLTVVTYLTNSIVEEILQELYVSHKKLTRHIFQLRRLADQEEGLLELLQEKQSKNKGRDSEETTDDELSTSIDTIAIRKQTFHSRRIRPVSAFISLSEQDLYRQGTDIDSPSGWQSSSTSSQYSKSRSTSFEALIDLPTEGVKLEHHTRGRPRPRRNNRQAPSRLDINQVIHQTKSENGTVTKLDEGLDDFFYKRVIPDNIRWQSRSNVDSSPSQSSLDHKQKRQRRGIFNFRKPKILKHEKNIISGPELESSPLQEETTNENLVNSESTLEDSWKKGDESEKPVPHGVRPVQNILLPGMGGIRGLPNRSAQEHSFIEDARTQEERAGYTQPVRIVGIALPGMGSTGGQKSDGTKEPTDLENETNRRAMRRYSEGQAVHLFRKPEPPPQLLKPSLTGSRRSSATCNRENRSNVGHEDEVAYSILEDRNSSEKESQTARIPPKPAARLRHPAIEPITPKEKAFGAEYSLILVSPIQKECPPTKQDSSLDSRLVHPSGTDSALDGMKQPAVPTPAFAKPHLNKDDLPETREEPYEVYEQGSTVDDDDRKRKAPLKPKRSKRAQSCDKLESDRSSEPEQDGTTTKVFIEAPRPAVRKMLPRNVKSPLNKKFMSLDGTVILTQGGESTEDSAS
ncbi:capping protein, Arp2/3 and myosin-I linker protein 3 [Protopterus annectens]|uniref:capping protein, Arp2/3 and myosin-I linker protein 3 n=1 Tax=Protopterus annectens TaxID=7888 RepID=UPI001CF9BBE3|nr:capping protein, Arp2/3 and myosin-I linker protein 3 [Protopterus annectens]